MVVGVCELVFSLPENVSLKGKRSVVKKIIHRTRNRFNVAMAEVDDLDIHTSAVIAFVVVGNDHRFINSCIDKIINFVDDLGLAELMDQAYEIEHY